jgi:glutamyl-tRNA reductase
MLISIAIDFRQADVATREHFHLSEERLTQLYRTARSEVVTEAALIATCNRTELYAWVDSDELLRTATRRVGVEAARHVVRIAAGLESQVLGDGQILGQLKAAYKRASRGHAAGPVLHRLFETALRAGKRVQTETSLTAGRNSIGAEAAITASQRFGNLENARCLVIGAGKTGARATKQLHKLGARDLVVVNRTFAAAQELAKFVGGRAAPFETLHVEAAMADVVIVATGSEVPVITAGGLQRAREACAAVGYALLLMDLSMPRNIEARVSEQPGITLVDLDTLHQPILSAETMRRDAVPIATAICDDEIASFMDWIANMPARDAIKPLRTALEDVARREVAFAAKDDGVAERAASRIVAKLLAGPMAALRRAVQRGEPLDAQAMMLLEMFSPSTAPAPRAIRPTRSITAKAVVDHAPPPSAVPAPPAVPSPVSAPVTHTTSRDRRPSMLLSPEQFT